ncbi:MAG TPA: transcriptional repressor [Solirubrobacteraceae bacterium]
MAGSASDIGALLRELGLRSTPQRRAILRAFSSGRAEHLSADEVHARASRELPDLGRGTVYSTLAELTEAGLLSAFGTSQPVRNPIPIAAPSHRVTRGIERPQIFVGGAERRRWLDAHERRHAA